MTYRDYDQLSPQELACRLRRIKQTWRKVAFSVRDGSPRSRMAAILAIPVAIYGYGLSDSLLVFMASGPLAYMVIMRCSRVPVNWREELAACLSRLEPVWSSPLRELNTGSASWSFTEYCLQQEMDLILIALRHPADRLNA